jgi:Uma2 family endonuclease
MSTAAPFAEKLLTAEEYLALPDDGRVTELVLGRIVEVNQPESLHGFYCSNISGLLREFVRLGHLGRVVSNDSGVVTRRSPDSVRGGDVLFYSYARVAKGTVLRGYWPAPDLIFEVKSTSDRWVEVISKAQEYLEANVRVVVVVDPQEKRAHVYTPDMAPFVVEQPSQLDLGALLPDVLPECKLAICEFFED